MRRPGYLALSFEVPAQREDELVAELWAAGCLGVQTLDSSPSGGGSNQLESGVELLSFFALDRSPEAPERWAAAVGGRLCRSEVVADRDWLSGYRAKATPFAVGRLFWLDPGDQERPAEETPVGRHLLRLPARRAFGTGSHATTALVLLLLEDLVLGVGPKHGRRLGPELSDERDLDDVSLPSSVLDVGCGSSVLGLAARRLGARQVVGLDLDLAAVFVARDNGVLNGERLSLLAGSITALCVQKRFPLVLVNVLPENLGGEEAEVAARLDDGGLLMVSGVLEEREVEVLARWQSLGLEPVARRTLEEWVAMVFRRPLPTAIADSGDHPTEKPQ